MCDSLFQHFTQCHAEFPIGRYRVDLYFPHERVAVECDGYGHSSYNDEYEAKRQAFIERTLGCRFYRFNPDEPYFSLYKHMRNIVQLINTRTSAATIINNPRCEICNATTSSGTPSYVNHQQPQACVHAVVLNDLRTQRLYKRAPVICINSRNSLRKRSFVVYPYLQTGSRRQR